MNNKSLAQFISENREKRGLSQSGLAKRANLTEEEVLRIESGEELFLATTTRQKLAKVLRLSLDEIKTFEKREHISLTDIEIDNEFYKEKILSRQADSLNCPVCGSPLISRVQEMYDLEDNLVLHAKANCSKCPFQIK